MFGGLRKCLGLGEGRLLAQLQAGWGNSKGQGKPYSYSTRIAIRIALRVVVTSNRQSAILTASPQPEFRKVASAAGGGYGANLFANPTQVFNSFRPALLGLDTRAYDEGPYHGQARWNVDFTIAKTTKITERVGTTFYAQFLNAFNHMMYWDPGMNIQDPYDFGTLTGQYGGARTIELGLRVAF